MKRTMQRLGLRVSLASLAMTALLAACGGSDKAADANDAGSSQQAVAAKSKPQPGAEVDPDAGLANAVIVGKTAAPVMLKYDVPAKPEVCVPFEVNLTFLTRQAAESLTAEVSGMAGLAVTEGTAARFEPVDAGGRYSARVLARADASGIFYLGVVAKVVTKVQSEGRTFSIPVVVGNPAPVAKPAPATDAAGEAIESMPATESNEKSGSSETDD
jgi:hypothetical protein